MLPDDLNRVDGPERLSAAVHQVGLNLGHEAALAGVLTEAAGRAQLSELGKNLFYG